MHVVICNVTPALGFDNYIFTFLKCRPTLLLLQMIKMTLIDDILPELSEDFTLMLTQAVSSDDVKGSTPTSGASILLAESTRSVSVTVSDHPYGLLQFSPGGAPPRPGDPPLPPATEGASVSVQKIVGNSDIKLSEKVLRI